MKLMNKLSAKRIYILAIIVLGVIAASIYSTYAIFSLETSSDNIISIRTPEELQISSSTYEYKQVSVPKNSYITTDVDIYNNLAYELCYSIWYKTIGGSIKIYENTTESLTTSGLVPAVTSKRISLIIVNDNDNDVKVNIGVAYAKNEDTCELNIGEDKSLITSTIDAKQLTDKIIGENKTKNNEAGYLTYKDITNELALSDSKTYYVANEFTYEDEIFTLKEPKELKVDELTNYLNYYLCEADDNCATLYHITEVNSNKITKYDTLIGYLDGESGLRKINNDYYYYGDNPNNFIYYNCTNELDTKTCELWRIIGFKMDSKTNKYVTKLVRNDYLDKRIFDSEKNVWDGTSIYKYLNEEYKLKQAIHEEFTFKQFNINSLDVNINEIPLLDTENKAKVVLVDVVDYLHTSTCQKTNISGYDTMCFKNNWLNKNTSEWTMTTNYQAPYIDEDTQEEITPENNTIYSVGNEIMETNISDKLNIRPVVYLKSRTILISGDGTLDNPYVIR